ncbi:MAG: hypothetical protein RLZZ419_1748 [Pseudomonadota bacterium]|jgi:hypothetical protein
MYLNQAGSSLIAFGNELNQIKAKKPHGEFIKGLEANIPMKYSQCNRHLS